MIAEKFISEKLATMVGARITKPMSEKIKTEALIQKKTVSETVREILDEYLDRKND